MFIASIAMQSCLDFDDPGTELGVNQVVTDNTNLKSGKVDSINYRITPTEESVRFALDSLNKGRYLETIKSGTYCLRGGKIQDGTVYKPASHAYQYQYNFGPDRYAQYFTIPHKKFLSGSLTSTYNVSAEFNGGPLGAYGMAKNVFIPLLHHPMIDSIPEIKAVVLLYYCLSAQEQADLSGPFTYIEDKQNSQAPSTYNKVEDIYYGIEANLDTIVNCLEHFETRPDWYKAQINSIMDGFNLTRDGLMDIEGNIMAVDKIKAHIKLANSLKLRMAMHISKVQPALAKEWAEEAVERGVIETVNDQMGFFQAIDAIGHPLVQISNWGDIRLSASLESLLMSLDHPYTKTIFKKNSEKIVNRNNPEEVLEANTRICGIRSGVYVGTGQTYNENQYQAYSTFDQEMMSNAPLYLIKFAEVDFLRAEGALRGWDMGGDARSFYERGIKNADLIEPVYAEFFEEYYSKYVDDYMAQEKPWTDEEGNPYVNVDPIGDGEPWQSVTEIGVAWNENDGRDTKLEKIITQKYLALFPLSTEAWTELRRTGYPKLFDVQNPDDGDGSLFLGDIIRRIPWVPTDIAGQQMVANSGLEALGGADEQATRLWWDVDGPNFPSIAGQIFNF